MDYEALIAALTEIKKKGPIRNVRPNDPDGGVGLTLEDELGVSENNTQAMDLEGLTELKTLQRRRTNTNWDRKVTRE